MSKQVTITLNEEIAAKLERIVALKGGTIEDAAIQVMAQYSDRYVKLVESASRAATNAKNRYDQ